MEIDSKLKLLETIFSVFSLDVSYLSNRIRIQKIVYLLQKSGLNLGYSFSFYIYGPYCSDLASDAYTVCNTGHLSSKIKFNDTDSAIITKVKTMIDICPNDSAWCELLGTIVYLIKDEKISETSLFSKLVEHQAYLNDTTRFKTAMRLLTQNGLL